ncbi:MAG: hypothetical protein P8N02_00255 [Actinomycetota bacterium]|nr:hypothetical protein [Actinomycetota bacterium]
MLLTACRADITVEIDLAPDGGGTVTALIVFDDEVIEHVPDLDQILRLDDVRATGWVIDQSRSDGGLSVRLVKPFGSVDQLPAVLSELDGRGGLFGDAVMTVERSGAVVTYELVLQMSLDRSVTDLIDPRVADVLDGELFGTPVSELERRAGGPLDDVVSLVVSVDIPGGSGRFPDTGSVGLANGGDQELVVLGEVVDDEIAAADAAAVDARDDVSRAATITLLVWVIVAFLAVGYLIIKRTRRPSRAPRPPTI